MHSQRVTVLGQWNCEFYHDTPKSVFIFAWANVFVLANFSSNKMVQRITQSAQLSIYFKGTSVLKQDP